MKKQLDFAAQFYDYFGEKPSKVSYEVRQDSNRYHDLVFMTSLIHDATFRKRDIKIRGDRLNIPIVRECCELGTVSYPDFAELYAAKAQLSIAPVSYFEWRFGNDFNFLSNKELTIEEIWIERERRQWNIVRSVVLRGMEWECQLMPQNFDDDEEVDIEIQLRDLEIPHLKSGRKGGVRQRPII